MNWRYRFPAVKNEARLLLSLELRRSKFAWNVNAATESRCRLLAGARPWHAVYTNGEGIPAGQQRLERLVLELAERFARGNCISEVARDLWALRGSVRRWRRD